MSKSIGEQLNDQNVKEQVNRGILNKVAANVRAKKKASTRNTPCRPSRRKNCGKYKELAKNEACPVNGCPYINRPKM
jgi:hypothetical protein